MVDYWTQCHHGNVAKEMRDVVTGMKTAGIGDGPEADRLTSWANKIGASKLTADPELKTVLKEMAEEWDKARVAFHPDSGHRRMCMVNAAKARAALEGL